MGLKNKELIECFTKLQKIELYWILSKFGS